jgi:ribose transport system substrate-binding protein
MRKLTVALMSLLLVALAAGCGGSSSTSGTNASSGSSADETISVDYANISSTAEVFQEIVQDVRRAGAKLGYDLRTYDNNFNGQTALSNAQLMVRDKPDVIIEWNGVQAVNAAAQRLFSRADISCVSFNTSPPRGSECHWFDLSNETVCGDTGRMVGEVAEKRRWTGSNTSVILVDAAVAGDEVNSCIGYFYEQLQRFVPGLAQIKSYADITPSTTRVGNTTVQVDGQGALAVTYTAVGNALSSIPKSNNVILYTVNDDETLGGMRALRRNGWQAGHMLTGGTGGGVAALQQLRTNPDWVAEGDVFISNLGEYFMAVAKALHDGIELPFLTTTPMAVLTKDTTIKGTTIVPIGTYFHPGETKPYQLPPLEPVALREANGLGKQTTGNDFLAKTGVLQKFGNVMGLN